MKSNSGSKAVSSQRKKYCVSISTKNSDVLRQKKMYIKTYRKVFKCAGTVKNTLNVSEKNLFSSSANSKIMTKHIKP